MAGTKKRKIVDGDDEEYDGTYQDTTAAKKTLKRQRIFKRTKTPKTTENLLLKLPGELRNRIYELAMPSNTTVEIRSRRSPSQPDRILPRATKAMRWREPGLLQTCKQIGGEAGSIYYGSNTFVFFAQPCELRKVYDFLTCKSNAAEEEWPGDITIPFSVHLSSTQWHDLGYWLALAGLAYHTHSSCAPKDLFTCPLSNTYVTSAMDEAVGIGRKGRERELAFDDVVGDFYDWARAKYLLCRKFSVRTAFAVRDSAEEVWGWDLTSKAL